MLTQEDRAQVHQLKVEDLVDQTCRGFQQSSAAFVALISRIDGARKAAEARVARAEASRAAMEERLGLLEQKLKEVSSASVEAQQRVARLEKELKDIELDLAIANSSFTQVRGQLKQEQDVHSRLCALALREKQRHEEVVRRLESEKATAAQSAVEAYRSSGPFLAQIDKLFDEGVAFFRERVQQQYPDLDLSGLDAASPEEDDAGDESTAAVEDVPTLGGEASSSPGDLPPQP